MITVTMLTKNSAETLPLVLDALRTFPEIIILDTGSNDATKEIARRYPNVTLHEAPFTSFGDLRNHLAAIATYDWILALDSDEVLIDPKGILTLDLKPGHTYSFSYRNFSRGKEITFCGWQNERHTRLYNRKETSFSSDKVHESLQELNRIKLPFTIHHYSYRKISDYLNKLERYTTLFAEQNKGRKSSLTKALLKSWWTFFKAYILKRGFMGGVEGYLISRYMAETTFYKYLKLTEAKCS